MRLSPLFPLALCILSLAHSSLNAQILLDQVMTKEDQKTTGVANLTMKQKIALENWLNQNFVLKQKEQVPVAQLSLSINIDNGEKLRLSDDSLWEVSPNDLPISAIWITPFPIKVTPSNDPDYPYLLVNINSGASVKAKKISPTAPAPASP